MALNLNMFQINELARVAQSMVENDQDYAESTILPLGYMLGLYVDGIWIVDANDTCVMGDMPRLMCLNGPSD